MSRFLKVFSVLLMMSWSFKSLNAADVQDGSEVYGWLLGTDLFLPEEVGTVMVNLAQIGADSLQLLPYVSVQNLTSAGVGQGAVALLMHAILDGLKPVLTPFPKGGDVEVWLPQHDLGRYVQDFKDRGFDTLGTICDVTEQNLSDMGMLHLHKTHFFALQNATKKQKGK